MRHKTHFGKPFGYTVTKPKKPTTPKKPTKKPKKPTKKPTKKPAKRKPAGSVREPNLKGQKVVKKTGKKPVLENPKGVAGTIRDRQRENAERIAKMFKHKK